MRRGLAVAVVVAACLIAPAPAAATHSVTVDCDGLQGALSTVDAGATITLQEGEVCTGAYTLPSLPTPGPVGSYAMWTFRGGGSGATFDAGSLGASERSLTGVDVHRLEIQNLTFVEGNVTGDGGAIHISGESGLGLRQSSFFDNHASGKGGAVYFTQDASPVATLGGIGISDGTFGSETDPTLGNTATTGGAVAIELPTDPNNGSGINGSTFANNTATANGGAWSFELSGLGGTNFAISGNTVVDNTAGGSGGGGYASGPIGFLNVDNELYEGNAVEPQAGGPAGDHFGGGLYLDGGLPDIANSVFRGNTVASFESADIGGGGLAVFADGNNANSEFNRFEGNTVAAQFSPSFESEGGGVYFSSPGARWYGFLDAVAGNSVGAGGEGGGMYVGAAIDPVTLELGEVTVANNTAGGALAGLAGGGFDTLIMRNSIVFNGANDIGGFESFDITWSDACRPVVGGPFTGAGNICANPLLVGGTNVHQTAQSPTIDAGNDAYFDSEGGGERAETDYEGDPRPVDGDGDGHTIDMGADESRRVTQQQPRPAPTPQCSDGRDNDSDGAIDARDPGCLAGPTDNNEGDETERDLFLCGQRVISLVRADVRGRRVVLSGLVAQSVAGQRVRLSVRYIGRSGRKQLGSVTPGADGRFQARVKKPARRLVNRARYRAQVGSARSVELKLPQSLASSSLRSVSGGMLELRGQVQRSLLGKRNPVVVKRIVCGQYTTVGRARPNRRGRYVVRFPAPTSGTGAALYRAETRVRARPGSRRYVRQFARALGITF